MERVQNGGDKVQMVLHPEVMEHMFPTAFGDHSPMWAWILELQVSRTRDSRQCRLFQGLKFVGCVLAAKGGWQKANLTSMKT